MRQEETFLLRRWREAPEEAWRMTIKDVKAGTVHFFHSELDLCKFLGIAISEPTTSGGDPRKEQR